MDNTQPNQNIKSLTIDCSYYFSGQLQLFINQFRQMTKHQTYSVTVISCYSDENMERLLKEIFELALNVNSYLIKF